MMKWIGEAKNGYKWDKRIVYAGFAITFGLMMMVFYLNGFNFSPYFYIECFDKTCPNPLMDPTFECKNEIKILWVIPLYKDKDCMRNCQEEWCTQKTLTTGTYGEKPKGENIIRYFFMIAVVVLVLSIFINHTVHNRGKRIALDTSMYNTPTWTKIKNKLKSIDKKMDDEKDKDNNKD